MILRHTFSRGDKNLACEVLREVTALSEGGTPSAQGRRRYQRDDSSTRSGLQTRRDLCRSPKDLFRETRNKRWLLWLRGLSVGCEPTGHRLDSQLGHRPGLQARSPVRAT